jgi:GDP-D-mannose dehydratase
MRARAVAKPSLPAKSHVAWPTLHQGLEDCLYMGNIDALRDWGHAKDYRAHAMDDATARPSQTIL